MVINDKKNFVVKENLFYKKYYTLSELLEINCKHILKDKLNKILL